MARTKKSKPHLNTNDFITIWSDKTGFTKADLKYALDRMKDIFEECIQRDIDIDIPGLIRVKVIDVVYAKPPGIVKFHGKNEFNNKAKRVKYEVPTNFRLLLKKQEDE